MEPFDLAVVNGRCVLDGGSVAKVNLGIKDGRIASVSTEPIAGRETIDVAGDTVIPGGVDEHFHVFVGYPWNTFENATKSALLGGITTVVDMPMDTPTTNTGELFSRKIQHAAQSSYVDFALFGGSNYDLAELASQARAGAVAVKTFTDHTAPPGMYDGLDAGQQYAVSEQLRGLGVTLAVHSEEAFICSYLTDALKASGRTDPGLWDEARPALAEYLGVVRTVEIAKATGCKTVVCHVSIPTGVDYIAQAKAEGHEVYAETCPHYLLLTKEDMERDYRLKWNPPTRSEDSVEELWRQVKDGRIDSVGSDQAPLPKQGQTIWDVSPGAGNMVQIMLPLMFSEGHTRGVSLPRLVDVLCTNPAKVMNLYPRKGAICAGADADLVVLDMHADKRVVVDDLLFVEDSEPWSPFEGRALTVVPRQVIQRGRVVLRDGKVLAGPGSGQFQMAVTDAPQS